MDEIEEPKLFMLPKPPEGWGASWGALYQIMDAIDEVLK